MAKLYHEFKNREFVILAIDVQETREIVKKYVEKEKLPFPVLLDINGKVSFEYGIRAHPAHFLINRHGELIGSALGAREWSSTESRNLIQFLVDQNKNEKKGPS
ncbi:MAG: TlpA family protein disulfide reductase [Desulfobacterales bacterium]|nr:MAG: TlpA family protein disulfide reductase [Desulfobacterales bacterium]